jgi:hypothetical protein
VNDFAMVCAARGAVRKIKMIISNDFTYTGNILKNRLTPINKSNNPKEVAFVVACNRPYKSLKRRIPMAATSIKKEPKRINTEMIILSIFLL